MLVTTGVGCGGVARNRGALAFPCGDNLIDELFDLGAFVAEEMRVGFGGLDEIDFEIFENECDIFAALFDVVHGHEAYAQISTHTQRAKVHGADVIFGAVAQRHDDVAIGVGEAHDAGLDKMNEWDFKKGKEAQFEGA